MLEKEQWWVLFSFLPGEVQTDIALPCKGFELGLTHQRWVGRNLHLSCETLVFGSNRGCSQLPRLPPYPPFGKDVFLVWRTVTSPCEQHSVLSTKCRLASWFCGLGLGTVRNYTFGQVQYKRRFWCVLKWVLSLAPFYHGFSALVQLLHISLFS